MTRHSSKTPSPRQLKVGETIRHTLSELFLRGDMYDMESGRSINVTVSEARVSPDLCNVTVYVMPFNTENRESVMRSLEQMAPMVRSLLAQKIRLKRIPAVTFRLDNSFDIAGEIESIFQRPEIQRDLAHE